MAIETPFVLAGSANFDGYNVAARKARAAELYPSLLEHIKRIGDECN